MEEYLGKIERAAFGFGGYQDAMIGIAFTLGGQGIGVMDFWGEWSIERTDHCKWTEEDRVKRLGETVMRISKLLAEAKKQNVAELVGVPVSMKFDKGRLVSWRVLTEVL